VRKGYELSDSGRFAAFWKMAALVQQTGEAMFAECGGEKVFAQGQLEMDVTELPSFTKHCFSLFSTPQQLGDALSGTSYWPFVMASSPWRLVAGVRSFDSGFTGWMQPEPYRRTVGFIWNFPLFGLENPAGQKITTVFNLHDWMVPASSDCPWGPSRPFGDSSVGDKLFALGRSHALQHLNEISTALAVPLQQHAELSNSRPNH